MGNPTTDFPAAASLCCVEQLIGDPKSEKVSTSFSSSDPSKLRDLKAIRLLRQSCSAHEQETDVIRRAILLRPVSG